MGDNFGVEREVRRRSGGAKGGETDALQLPGRDEGSSSAVVER
jgi:hypothetical protein